MLNLKVISKLPLPKRTKLSWQRSLLERSFSKDIEEAQRSSDYKLADRLRADQHFELRMHDEEEDSYLTKRLLTKARRCRVPVPSRYDQDGSDTGYFYEGKNTGGWYLTRLGIEVVRESIRKEQMARAEARAHWIPWLTALSGGIGVLTGLVAVLKQ
ncbi:hypothetical protein S4A8_14145 [Salinisphaera sp. S4-8]